MHCENCGTKLESKICSACGHEKFENAVSVSVIMVPVRKKDGSLVLLGVRRNIQPKLGELALPGGFQEIESAHFAGLRELEEETGIDLKVEVGTESLFHDSVFIRSTPDNRRNLVFMTLKKEIKEEDINFNFINKETQEVVLLDESTKLAFPLHEQAVQFFFKTFKHHKEVLRPQVSKDDLV